MHITGEVPQSDDREMQSVLQNTYADNRLAVHIESGRLRALMNCSCGHTVVSHTAQGDCRGVTIKNKRCACVLSDVSVLDAAIESFGGSSCKLLSLMETAATD